jgi:CubicO group peptidase (beta-lactamase class C family)
MFAPANAQQKNDKQLSTAFDKVLEQQFKLNETGVTALVSKNGKIIYKRALGMANLELNVPMQFDNVFRIGSVTKQFTAVAILQLMEKGKLNLQDEITRFIPDYPAQGYKITIEHLLTHTSGIQDFTSIKDNEKRSAIDYTPKEMIDYFKGPAYAFCTRNKMGIQQFGYFYWVYHRKSYRQYLRTIPGRKFFKPLGMTNSFYANDSSIIKNRATGYTRGAKDFENARYISMTQPYAAGSIQSTVEDLFKWNQAIQSHKLLKKETLDKAFTGINSTMVRKQIMAMAGDWVISRKVPAFGMAD